MVDFSTLKKKTKYRIRNWTDYARSLQKRGSLTVWISEETIENCLLTEKIGSRDAASDVLIRASLELGLVHNRYMLCNLCLKTLAASVL